MKKSDAKLRVRKLDPEENISTFDCGDADLNSFILEEAVPYQKELLAVTYVVEDEETDEMVAYFSMANDRVSLNDFENKTEFNRFRKHLFVNEKRLRSYPAVKLCRLGVSDEVKGNGIGTRLLNYIKGYFTTDNKAGCRFLTVDAYTAARLFYQKNKFVPLNEDDEDSVTRSLFYDLKSTISKL